MTLGEYLSSLEVQNNYISSLCKKWADEPKLALFLAKALRSHTKAKDSLIKLFENNDKQSDLWPPLRDLFSKKTEFVEIISTAKYLMKLHRKTDFQFCALCLVDRLFEFFREGQTMVVIFGGQTHALYLTKLFKTALQWDSVADISCLLLGDLSLKEYTIPENYHASITEITQNCMASHAVAMLNNVNTPQCFYCLNQSSAPLYKCAKCKFAEYCCKECQVKGWPEHKKSCGKSTLL